MGVERSVTRWYVRYQQLQNELLQLEKQLAQIENSTTKPASSDEDSVDKKQALSDADNQIALLQELAGTRKKIQSLGPCPKPMMG